MHAIVAHTDIDGVAAAALYIYLSKIREYRLFFTEPFLMHKTLERLSLAYYDQAVIVDLGINPQVYTELLKKVSQLRGNDVEIEWYDHHVWEETWISDLERLGVKLYLDSTTCTTGIVANHLKQTREVVDRNFVAELVRGVCSGDLWKFEHWLGPFYIRLVRRRDRDSWRKHVVKVLVSGKYWSEDFSAKVEDHVDKELQLFSGKSPLNYIERTVGGLKLVVAETSKEVENSFVASYMLSRLDADIVVLVSSDGKLSLRSRSANVRDLAHKLGGGGHIYASGAKIEIPWFIKLLARVNRRTLLNYVAKLVERSAV